MNYSQYKKRIITLRASGRTYSEICIDLGLKIPKSTLSYYCNSVTISKAGEKRISEIKNNNLICAQVAAVVARKEKWARQVRLLYEDNRHLANLLRDKQIAKLVLSALYLGEGSKGERSAATFGNSDEKIIWLYLSLLRSALQIDESKLRCTVQCRAGADVNKLMKYWSKVTSIPLSQFLKAQIDRRYGDKIRDEQNYKGVCRLDYLSSATFKELMMIGKIMCGYTD